MRTLRFDVQGQRLTRSPDCDFSGIVRGTNGYLKALFITDSEWEKCNKAAAFYSADGKEAAAPVVEGECEIPADVLTGGVFSVRLVGMRAADYRITTNKLFIEQEG